MIVEYLPGEEYTVDALALSGAPIITIPEKESKLEVVLHFRQD